ncbi:hypothetical protein QTP86_024379, partial [Hemibagrus guttatus]
TDSTFSMETQVFLSVEAGPCPSYNEIDLTQEKDNINFSCSGERVPVLGQRLEVQWWKDCKSTGIRGSELNLFNVSMSSKGNYTCLVIFRYEDKNYTASFTYHLAVMKKGVGIKLECNVLIGIGEDSQLETSVYWMINYSYVATYPDLQQNLTTEMRENSRLYGRLTLFIPEILPEFFGIPFECIILNPNGNDIGQVWLSQDDDTNHIWLIIAVFLVLAVIVGAVLLNFFKIDLILAYRHLCGKDKNIQEGYQYHAFVLHLHGNSPGSSAAEDFALRIVPSVLEQQHNLKLFIHGRDTDTEAQGGCMPWRLPVYMAVYREQVQENLERWRFALERRGMKVSRSSHVQSRQGFMGLKDHLDDGAGHILDLGLDLDYLHVKAVDRQAGADALSRMDRGSLDTSEEGAPSSGRCPSSSRGDSEDSCGSDGEVEQSCTLAPSDGSARAVHPPLCRSPCLDLDSPGLPEVTQDNPNTANSLREYQTKLEFALKLGYAEDLVRLVLSKLGSNALINDILGELVKLGSKSDSDSGAATSSTSTSSSLASSGSSSSSACSFSDSTDSRHSESPSQSILDDKDNLRPIVVDGSNVAMSHGNKEVFSCQGIQLAVDWFLERGHKDITVFVPAWRKEQSRPDALITGKSTAHMLYQEILRRLEKDKILVFTPSRRVQGRRVVCYDDRFIVKLAYESDGIIVSNDNYRDLAVEKPEWKKFIDERLLMYSFVNDKFMPPDDPLGRHGPSLENFLRKRPIIPEHKKQPCPYGKKCTYGHKCKFYHPERGTQPQRAVADELRASAKTSAAKGTNESGLVKSHSVPGGSRNDKAGDGKRSHSKRQSDSSVRTLSYGDVEDKLSSKSKADPQNSSLTLPPAPGGPPSCNTHTQDQREQLTCFSKSHAVPAFPQTDSYPTCESPDLSYYSLVRGYSGLSLSSQRSPERPFLSDMDTRLSSVASDCSSEGSASSDSYGTVPPGERSCMSSPDSLLDDGLKCHHYHHLHHHRRQYPLPMVLNPPPHHHHQSRVLSPIPSSHPGYHHGMARGHSFTQDDQPLEPHFKHPVSYIGPQVQHQMVGARSSCPGEYPPQNSPLSRGLASTRLDSVSDSRLYQRSPLLARKPFPDQDRMASWEPYYQQPCYEPFTFQSLPENRQQAWRVPWGQTPLHPSPPHPSHTSHQNQEPPALSRYQELREKVFGNLCNIFPTELVRLVMGRYPHVTDAQQLAAAILAEKSQNGY